MPTPNESTPDFAPTQGFDPIAYWIENKGKVLLYAGLLIGVLAAYAAYEISVQHAQTSGRLAFAEAKTADDFQSIIRNFPKTVVAGDARLMLAGQLRDGKKYDEATATLRAFIADTPLHPLISSAWLSLAETLDLAGKPDEALDTYQQTVTRFPDSYAAPIALAARAKLLQSGGKVEDAKRTYESVLAQYPESIVAREVMRELQVLKK